MNVNVNYVSPKNKKKMKLNDFAKWEPFTGMTEEQEDHHKKTYVDYIMSDIKTKEIYFCLN